ncbi:hypothetical protein [Thalassoporum mexicanum]|uniref:hypothetical protein n=1 Tax=Thalassoporum mexicanum TaxID=3457544 RepID=UPI0005A24DE5|nr:hypothetical protein [Pseudanabaena sp. PCC 7367]
MTFFETDPQLQEFGDRLIRETTAKLALSSDRLAITFLVHDRNSILNSAHGEEAKSFWQQKIRGYRHRGIEITYPAGLVNLFYMLALQEWLATGMIANTTEIDRALADAIANCSYDASNYIVDILSGTTSGPEITNGPFATWQYQRQIVNRYFHNLGVAAYKPINVCQKLWRNGPYGRERTFHGDTMANRNMLTTDATAHLLYSIMTGIAISKERAEVMQKLLKRSPSLELINQPEADRFFSESQAGNSNRSVGGLTQNIRASNNEPDDHHHYDHIWAALPAQSSLWAIVDHSKHSMEVSNYAMYVEIPDQPAFTLVAFCESYDQDGQMIQTICQQILAKALI